MPETKQYYRTLQVDPSAEPEIITAAYRRLALKYHPDSNKSPDAVRRMQEINEAYEILSDPAKRQRYNLQLSGQQHRTRTSPPGPRTVYPERGQESREAAPAQNTAGTQEADRQLGCSFMVVFSLLAVLLLRLFLTRITSPWMILLILLLAGMLTLPVVFKIDDFLRKS